ncbi:MAG: restriction endonuclease [Spirochaetes bacterium]|nr:restriction endonuclease [Spirochaetota bacterium]
MHFDHYIQRIREENTDELAYSIESTTKSVINPHISNFSYTEHITGLLLGNVQSGKTSQVFGIVSAAADEGFKIFILLTTDSVYLQQQTFSRAINFLDTFNVCGEDDEVRFFQNNLRKPSLIILKKNTNILKRWNNNLASSNFCIGNPLFIIDDEADAASLNTKINKNDISAINSNLESIKQKSSSSIYLQVTATPQAIMLQKINSGWKPGFVYYFQPGKKYMGGNFFYSKDPIPNYIKFTSDDELDDLLSDDEFPDNGLIKSLCSFLIISSHLFLSDKQEVSNFLIHPSIRISDHEQIAEKIGTYLNRILAEIFENKLSEKLFEAWNDLKVTNDELLDFEEAHIFINDVLENDKIKLLVMNSRNEISDYNKGINIIVGGNSLGRGVTFPNLNAVYYCRRARTPQADTFWQHCRIFGYDRNPKLVRLFIPAFLYKLFSELNDSNNSIINQVLKYNIDDVRLLYYGKTRPTRLNVIDQSELSLITGGTNYFPFNPGNKSIEEIDDILKGFDDTKDYHLVNPNYVLKILDKIDCFDADDWSSSAYADCVNAYIADKPGEQCILIVRRKRDIGKGTGTLLSPNDRILGNRFDDKIVLTVYKIIGNKDKGWNGNEIWIPNIKFPDGINFYKV